jgi:hypothetical protein
MVLGILGEYLGAVFDEVKRRPLYIIDEVLAHHHREQNSSLPSRWPAGLARGLPEGQEQQTNS